MDKQSQKYFLAEKTKTKKYQLFPLYLLKLVEILSVLEAKGWIGLQISESWLWEDGTTVNENLFEFLKMDDESCAYIEGNYVYTANCLSGKSYICELTI
ncbi:NKG2-D type II integral membrane protein-like [Bos mutus]|uniref:NKG2-D type II integral membrane protein-like n=1 Tax=Bos mutus TaxID=72004 RepID=UPI0038B50D08